METKSSLIKIVDHQLKWEEAINQTVELLVNHSIATNELAKAIIENTKKLGPYYVLMPRVALAHTSPGDYNKKIGLSLLVSKQPIQFSDDKRHEVNLLFTLSAKDGNSHMEILKKFAQLFQDEKIVDKALEAENEQQLYELFKEII